MTTVYINSAANSSDNYPSPDTDYGIKHFDNQGMPANGMEETQYPPMLSPKWNIDRLENFEPKPFMFFPAPSIEGYLEMGVILRRFINSDRQVRKIILTQQMGFSDTGIAIGGDAQFIYRFNTEPSQIELYISSSGEVTELNRFNQSKFEETRIPLNQNGFQYMFMQVCGNLNRWDFNKFDQTMINKMTDEQRHFRQKIISSPGEIDYIDNVPIHELLRSGAAGRIERGEVGLNYPITEAELSENNRDIRAGISSIAQQVNDKIKTREIALQFVLEELDAARQGDETARKFVRESGFSEDEYIGAMGNSIEEVDGDYGPQQSLVSFISEITMGDFTIMSKYKVKVVEEIMLYWSLGKYS